MSDLDELQKDVNSRINQMRNRSSQVGMEDVVEQGKGFAGINAEDGETKVKSATRREHKSKGEPMNMGKLLKVLPWVGIALLFVIVVLVMSSSLVKRQQQATDDWLENISAEEPEFAYSDSEIELLRLNGFTGYEIEEYAAMGYPADALVEEAEAERQSLYAEEYASLLDGASDEFKALRNKTWLGQSDLPVSENTSGLVTYSQNMNLDYEKVAASGYQLWIKLYVNGDSAIFMAVPPDRWNALADSGNMVVSVSYVKLDNGYSVITNIQEIPTN